MLLFDKEPPPSLVPTHSPDRSSTCWRVSSGVGRVVLLGLLLGGALLAATSCTLHVDRVILYNTEMAKPSPTPRLN